MAGVQGLAGVLGAQENADKDRSRVHRHTLGLSLLGLSVFGFCSSQETQPLGMIAWVFSAKKTG